MKINMLDHIALYMSDRDEAAGFLTTRLGFHVVDHTERYTLVGAGGKLGKLTLFDAPQGTTPSPGEIGRITIRVADPEAAAKELPPEADAEPSDGGYSFTGPEGLPLALVPGEGKFANYDLEGFTLRLHSPEESARKLVEMGFAPGDDVTVRAGDYLGLRTRPRRRQRRVRRAQAHVLPDLMWFAFCKPRGQLSAFSFLFLADS
jgi:catechol 2,3-dioxygenase-like lactoylglutathione lyase family enzyme